MWRPEEPRAAPERPADRIPPRTDNIPDSSEPTGSDALGGRPVLGRGGLHRMLGGRWRAAPRPPCRISMLALRRQARPDGFDDSSLFPLKKRLSMAYMRDQSYIDSNGSTNILSYLSTGVFSPGYAVLNHGFTTLSCNRPVFLRYAFRPCWLGELQRRRGAGPLRRPLHAMPRRHSRRRRRQPNCRLGRAGSRPGTSLGRFSIGWSSRPGRSRRGRSFGMRRTTGAQP